MQWKTKYTTPIKPSTIRYAKSFAWLPVECSGDTVWLEWYMRREIYDVKRDWSRWELLACYTLDQYNSLQKEGAL